MKKDMLLIDGHGLAFRGFYALPETLRASDGTPTNAIVGFTNMLLKGMEKWNTSRLGLFFDPKGPTRRHEMFKEYKGGRKPTPESFKTQLPIIIELSRAMGIPVFIRDGIEADDYIVSTAIKAAEDGWTVKILSADKDLFQIIRDDITVIRPTKGVSDFKIYNEEFFRAEYGFEPASMADYLALVGDAADNIPGIPGIGDKTARELIGKFSSLEGIYKNIDELSSGRRARLEDNYELVYRSRDLIIPQQTECAAEALLVMNKPDSEILDALCSRLGLGKLLKRLIPDQQTAASIAKGQSGLLLPEKTETRFIEGNAVQETQIAEFAELLIYNELAMSADETDKAIFHLFSRDGHIASVNISDKDMLSKWRTWCGKGTLTLYGYREMLVKSDIPLPPINRIHDVEIAHYLLHPDRGGSAVKKTVGHQLNQGAELVKELFMMWDEFEPKLKEFGLLKLMEELDLPLCPVLADLQREGIFVDSVKLAALESELGKIIITTEQEIESMVGERINLNSPKQVSWLLFDHLKLPPLKKIQTGYSTNMSVLEELARLPEPLCDAPMKIIQYREQAKLLSGFVQPFLTLAKSGDGRIHSTFDHLATGTGRLASRDPNVQNLPVFGESAVKFRDCFVPSHKDSIFVAADYSQIELRVLAHLSGEERLIEAFKEGRDVHMETASWVFGLPAEEITQEQRRFAKVVNFGLLYGMSAHGLSQRLGISRPQAASMVERYFGVLPKVRHYLESSISEAKSAGFTRSIFGRIRPLNEVSTVEGRGNNPIDRVAVNTPIQSAASDIAKIALIRFNNILKNEFSGASSVLQIHDSIVCECLINDADAVEKRLVEVMESVDVLIVPVKVESKRGCSLSNV